MTLHFDRSTSVQALCLLGVGLLVIIGRHHLSTAPVRQGTGIALTLLGIGHLGSSIRSIHWNREPRAVSLSYALFALGDFLAICGGVVVALERTGMDYLMISAVSAIVIGALMNHIASPAAVTRK